MCYEAMGGLDPDFLGAISIRTKYKMDIHVKHLEICISIEGSEVNELHKLSAGFLPIEKSIANVN